MEVHQAGFPDTSQVPLEGRALEEMERRAQVVGDPNNQDAQAKAVEAGLIKLDSEASPPAVSWLYSRWDPTNKTEVTDELLTPLTHEALLRRFASVRKRISGETLLRCHTTRPLTVGMQGETVVLLVELATNNPDSQAMHEAFQDLCQLAMWRAPRWRFSCRRGSSRRQGEPLPTSPRSSGGATDCSCN